MEPDQGRDNDCRPYLRKLEARLLQRGLGRLNDDLPARERTAARKQAETGPKVLKGTRPGGRTPCSPLPRPCGV